MMQITAPNPFFHRGPVRDPAHFFGRKRETTTVVDLLCQGQSIAISGARRLGKTSLLFHLGHADLAATHRLGPSVARWVYLDGGMLDGLDETWFYGAVDRGLGGDDDALPYARFVERIRALAAERVRLILAIDEFELVAANPHFGRELFNRLRGLMAQYGMQCLTASKAPLVDLTFAHPETLSSPFFNMFAPLRVSLFTDDAALTLLSNLSTRGRRPFGSQTLMSLRDLAGPHPLFLQVAGYHAFAALQEQAGGELSSAALAAVRSQTLADIEPHLRYAWSGLDAEARHTLAALPVLAAERPARVMERLTTAGMLRDGQYAGGALEVFIRRQQVEGLLQGGDFVLDMRRGRVAVRGQPVHLTPTEFAALRLFLERPGLLLTPQAIEAALWPNDIAPDPERARGVVKKLRAALGPAGNAIHNRRGQGYLLSVD